MILENKRVVKNVNLDWVSKKNEIIHGWMMQTSRLAVSNKPDKVTEYFQMNADHA